MSRPNPNAGKDARELLKSRLALTVAEVADCIGTSPATVRSMIASGELAGCKIGGGTERVTYVVPVPALNAWLEGKRCNASQEDVA